MKPIPLNRFVLFGSSISILFGVWHFFVPGIWDWVHYIDQQAIELMLAITAINFFFSLSLILFGFINLALIIKKGVDVYSVFVVLCANCILWLSRILFQVVQPQGTINPWLQFGMLFLFILVFLCFVIPWFLLLKSNRISLK